MKLIDLLRCIYSNEIVSIRKEDDLKGCCNIGDRHHQMKFLSNHLLGNEVLHIENTTQWIEIIVSKERRG